jgi:hypothetical protein
MRTDRAGDVTGHDFGVSVVGGLDDGGDRVQAHPSSVAEGDGRRR